MCFGCHDSIYTTNIGHNGLFFLTPCSLLWHHNANLERNGAIMRPPEFSAASIATLLGQQKIATLPELMTALGTDARRTVFRKLQELPSRTSYSHRGRYYTLDDVAAFDELGLWTHEEVWFSNRRHTAVDGRRPGRDR